MILDTVLPTVNKTEYRWSRMRVANEDYIREQIFESDLIYLNILRQIIKLKTKKSAGEPELLIFT